MFEGLNDFLFNATMWMVVGLVFVGLEFMAPGVYFMWVGFAAIVVSVVTFIFPSMAWEFQLLLFAVLGVTSVLIGKKYIMEKDIPSDDSTLNRRGTQYVGKNCEVVVAFKNGKGKVKVEDTLWSAIGDKDFAEGNTVKVVGMEGTRLVVAAK